jgi:hypothetical protein
VVSEKWKESAKIRLKAVSWKVGQLVRKCKTKNQMRIFYANCINLLSFPSMLYLLFSTFSRHLPKTAKALDCETSPDAWFLGFWMMENR